MPPPPPVTPNSWDGRVEYEGRISENGEFFFCNELLNLLDMLVQMCPQDIKVAFPSRQAAVQNGMSKDKFPVTTAA